MPIVKVYQCPRTNKYFPLSKKKAYVKHLKTMAADNLRRKKDNHWRDKVFQFYKDDCANVVKTPADLQEWWNNNFNKLVKMCLKSQTLTSRFELKEDTDYSHYRIIFNSLRFNPTSSNSHEAPWNEETNWGRDKPGVPTSFPGLTGQVTGYYDENERDIRLSDFLTHFGICTGSGGGGGGSLSYGVTIWFQDHVAIKDEYFDQLSRSEEWAKFAREEYNEIYNERKDQYENRPEYIVDKIKGEHFPFDRVPYPYRPKAPPVSSFTYNTKLAPVIQRDYLRVLKDRGYRLWFNDGERIYVVRGSTERRRAMTRAFRISQLGQNRHGDTFYKRERGHFYGTLKKGFEEESEKFFNSNKAPYKKNTLEIPDDVARLQDEDYRIGL